MNNEHVVSPLNKTWIFDLDGTILKHNGYIEDGKDSLLNGSKEFISKIPIEDKIIFLTSRTSSNKENTEIFLRNNSIRYDHVIYDLPFGERILINDKKESGLTTAIAINTTRNEFMNDVFIIDVKL